MTMDPNKAYDLDEKDKIVLASRAVTRKMEQQAWRVLGILSALMAFGAISTDLYLPAMPMMAQDLGSGIGVMEWTISGYLIGFSLGQLLWGPIGDRFGRKWPVAIGLILFVIGSAGCALANDAQDIISWRVIQAIGACASVVLSRAMVRDLYQGDKVAQMMSILLMVMAVAPLLGPIVGGQILNLYGWRFIFWSLVIFGVMTLAALMTLPETLPRAKRNHDSFLKVYFDYGEVLRNRKFLAFVGAGGFFFSGLFSYIAGTPFAYITYYHVPDQLYGLVFGLGVIGMMCASYLNARLVMKLGCARMLIYGAAGAAIAGVLLIITAKTNWGGLWGLVGPLFLFISMAGFIIANSVTGALSHYPERAGAVSALVGVIQYGFGIVGSAVVGALADNTPWPMGLVIGIAGIGCFLCASQLKRDYT